MAIITNGTTIPTSGDYIVVNGVKIDKVIAVKNNVSTTVWEKIIFEYKNFAYTGNVQAFVVPVTGLYKLEVWGASGGGYHFNDSDDSVEFGYGGYSYGYKYLVKDQALYICIGGMGAFGGSGGYNGGGTGGVGIAENDEGGGGGATHIATTNRGTLPNYANYQSEVLIVAGGGGGNARYGSGDALGGTGGGTNGGNGDPRRFGEASYGYTDTTTPGGGTQTEGGKAGNDYEWDEYDYTAEAGSFGKGGAGYSNGGGGGGGWYGGGGGCARNGHASSGGGGSGYIGGVPAVTYNGITYSPSTSNGENQDNGYAKITLIAI